ncbi:MAG: FAD-binding oxidoreductase [Chlamydiae bacterium]|nr:FAD-binding oxidoreductase [Chlamydiota bacterium]
MRVAIIGAGFSGLALAYHLLQHSSCSVTIFDGKGIGAESSGIASGLLHPYPGEKGRRSWKSFEGMQATKELLTISEKALGRPVADTGGILRFIPTTEENTFLEHERVYKDVSPIGNGWFLLHSGMTVYTSLYLEGLWKAVFSLGAKLHTLFIDSLSALDEYDCIVVAAGAGTPAFLQMEVELQQIKGQILTCTIPEGISLTNSLIGKGYIATMPEPGFCHVGATYERGFTSLSPNIETAKELLYPKLSLFYPKVVEFPVVDCKAAVRVARKGHYIPFVKKIGKKHWVMTALGSRGLLYHGYLGKVLAQAIVEEKESVLPVELGSAIIKNSL